MPVPPLRASAYTFYMSVVSQANTNIFQTNPTIVAGDFQVSIDGGAFNNLTALPTVSPAGSKQIEVALTAAEMTGDAISVLASDQAGNEWQDKLITFNTDTVQMSSIADAVHDEVVEGALTLRNIIRILLSFVAGEASGGGTANIAFRNQADSLDRITMTVDANGNRTATTVDGS